jgi:putative ABC transport system ATP-binding protein
MILLHHLRVLIEGTPIIHDISAEVHQGDFITIVGTNGSGKSTLFNMLSGQILPTSGKITLDGEDLQTISCEKKAQFISHLQQNPSFNCVPSMTVEENFALALNKGRKTTFRNAIRNINRSLMYQALSRMYENVEELLSIPMKNLSGGQRQMIALIMATVHPPRILLLDEPTAALDPKAATKLLIFASQLSRQYKITTLLITHDPYIAIHLGSRLWVMREGRIHHQYGEEKRHLHSEHLIGGIDYEKLRQHNESLCALT